MLHKPLFIQLNLKVLNILHGGTLSLCVFPPPKFGFTVLAPSHLIIFRSLHLQTMLPRASLPRLLSLVSDYSSGRFPDTGLSGSGDTFIFRFEHPTSLPFRKKMSQFASLLMLQRVPSPPHSCQHSFLSIFKDL